MVKRYTGRTSKIPNSRLMDSSACACCGETLFDHWRLRPDSLYRLLPLAAAMPFAATATAFIRTRLRVRESSHDRLCPILGASDGVCSFDGTMDDDCPSHDLTHVKRTFTMAGTDPSKTNTTTTFTVWVIPIKFVYDASHGNHTFDPKHKLSNGRTVIQNTLKSPLFNAGIDFKQGATDLGNTQYIDVQQHDEGEKDAAGVEAPGQQDSRSERGVIVKVNRGRRNRQQPGGQRKHCGKQQYASWHKQGFKRSVGSQFQAGMILWLQGCVNELSSAG